MTDDPGMAQDDAAQTAPPGGDPSQADAGAPQDAQPDAGAAQDATPEEQAQYNQFVGRGMELIYNQKMFPQVVEMLRGGGGEGQGKEHSGATGSAQGLAHATAMIITRVYKAATDSGAELSPDVLFHGGTEIFGQLAEISDKAGISNYAEDRDGLEAAYFLSVDTAMQQLRQAGVVDEASAKQALQQLHDMDAKGALEPVFRELDAMDQQSRGGEAENPAENQAEGGVEEPPANDNGPVQGGMAPQEEME
ncbi:hypothetical protein NL532_23990 [Mesorhizobium sp. C120A]|uniref:hypothetical protein n=1 Tax=unclassified Mesorhizobium TaxID=325217 RepID=UPI0004143324|nr:MULTISPECIES: hypothetical protein [unclassified Mesorhizobium]WJI43670.1 hypothetical protein NL532_23990 [Mesorhizobium sp. C120A]